MVHPVFKLSFASEMFRAKQAVAELLAFVSDNVHPLSEEDAFDLRLIFSEIIYNAVAHGNGNDQAKQVHVRAEINGGTVRAAVADEGAGFNYAHLLSKFDLGANASAERGRGIQLVYALADALSFSASGNKVEFIKKVAQNG